MYHKIAFVIVNIYLHFEEAIGTVYIKSREASSWSSAREHCTEFGGHLATLTDFQEFRTSVQTKQTTLDSGEELWVGASLQKGQWKWEGDNSGEFKAGGQFYARGGCIRHDFIDNGTSVDNLTPEKCLNLCHWQGVVGLQKDRCYCSDEFNVSDSRPGVCHIKCDPRHSEMCGGYSSVSLYKPGKQRISWANQEPKIENNCVFLRKGSIYSDVEYVSGNCDMRARFLCRFYDNELCGLYQTCFRWSTTQATWDIAVQKCKDLNGSLAELSRSGKEDVSKGLGRLPPGIFWVSLRRDSDWQWINGGNVNPLLFHFGKGVAQDQTCSAVTNINGVIAMVAGRCDLKKYYLCQYDYMKKRDNDKSIANPGSPFTTGSDTSALRPSSTNISSAIASDIDDNITEQYTDDETDSPESSPSKGGLVFTCMYMVLGFVSGMVCVLIIGLIVYLICRCKQPADDKHSRLTDQTKCHEEDHSVHYSSKDDSVQISTPHSDITYDTVYDLESESPFRRTQRLIRMGSANSWRHAQSRRAPTDINDSPEAGYTWRGMIGGDVEIINTELRHHGLDRSNSNRYDESPSYGSGKAIVEYQENPRADVRCDFDEIEALYDLPERSDSFDYEKGKRRSGRNPRIPSDQRFLEIRTSRSSESNEENIYATIKKTFQKIKEEMAEEAKKSAMDDEDLDKMTYTVKLN